jgi:hypothetical protein
VLNVGLRGIPIKMGCVRGVDVKIDEYNKIQDKIFSDIKIIRDKKGHDYATDTDTLRNFKVISTICRELDIDPRRSSAEVSMFFEVVKLARKANLKGKDPKNESMVDTVEDQVNYACLTIGCLEDDKK